MTAKIEFRVSNQTDFLNEPLEGPIHDIKLINNKTTGKSLICLRYGNDLIGYEFNIESNAWKYAWSQNVFGNNTSITVSYPITKYQWFIADVFGTGNDVIIIRSQNGVQFYEQADSGLKLITVDGSFHDLYRWYDDDHTFLLGQFYPDLNIMSALSRNEKGVVKFYGIQAGQVTSSNPYPLFPLTTKLQLNASWSDPKTRFHLTKFDSQSKDSIILQTDSSIEIYQFNADYDLKLLIKTSKIDAIGRIFFANVTNRKTQDILNLNENGLFLYQFDDNAKEFKLLRYNDMFSSKYRGWNEEFTESIRFVDLNNDGLSDLVFTGSQGLSVLSYNTSENDWEFSLLSNSIDASQRFSTVVSAFNFNQKPTVLLRKPDGNINWGTMNVVDVSIPPVPPIVDEDSEIPWSPSSITPSVKTNLQLPEVPVLRWTNQWDGGFVKDIVNVNNGQVEFSVPFIDLDFSTGLNFQLAIQYSSADASDNLLGVGWSVPAIEYYITVDRSSSIFQDDFIYYLVRQNNRQQLELKSNDNGKLEFTLDEQPDLAITFHSELERWIIKSKTEEVVFGKNNNPNSSKALQFGLGWPIWNGSGTELDMLEPIVFSWYVTERRFMKTGGAIHFEYENDMASISNGKSYTNGIRLKSMSNGVDSGRHIELVFEYEKKSESEYTVFTPINAEGVLSFPIQLTQAFVLKGYNLSTGSYRQNILFGYEINNDVRVLKEIQQNVLNSVETILKFDYKPHNENILLQRCHLPTGASVDVEFKSVNPINPPLTHRYATDSMVNIIKGPDYAVMAYRSLGLVEVVYRVYDVNMNKSDFGGTTNDGTKKSIEGFMARAYKHTFVIVQETKTNKEIYFYARNDKKWSPDPTTFQFPKDAYVRFGQSFVAVASPGDKEFTMFNLNVRFGTSTSTWEKEQVGVPDNGSMQNFIVQNQMVVGHDEKQLWSIHIDSQKQWKSFILDYDISSYLNMNKNTFDKFDFGDETKTQLNDGYKFSGLQVVGNFVSISGIQENGDRMSVSITSYLLGSNYDVVKKTTTEIERENLLDLSYDLETDGSTFTIKYTKKDNKYSAYVEKFSGKIMEKFDEIGNKNQREDAINEQLEAINKDDDWHKVFKQAVIFKADLYQTQLNREGVFCGNDILLKMTGTQWERTKREDTQNVLLGPKFLLQFSNADPLLIKMYRQDENQKATGDPLREIKLKSAGQIVPRYPAYIAYQSPQNTMEVITFEDYNTLGEELSFPNESLILESDFSNLMTMNQNNAGTNFEWIARSIQNIVGALPRLMVDFLTVTVNNVSRKTAYEYFTKYDDVTETFEQKVITIPGGDRKLSGWYEQSYVVNLRTTNTTESFNAFYADGQKIENLPKEDKNQNDKVNATVDYSKYGYQLYDRSGEWVISNFMPFKMTRNEVAYFGFEPYEVFDADWQFDEKSIVRGGFAFTGDSYLHLDAKNSVMERSIQPENDDQVYVASGWIRANQPLKLNTPTSVLRAVILNNNSDELITIQSRASRQSGEWYYVEVVIDLPFIKSSHSDLKKPTIKLIVSPIARLDSLDLDHIRFSPVIHDFAANVFSQNGALLATIDNKGLVLRKIYDNFGKEIATVRSDGVVENFYRISQSGHLEPQPQEASTNPTSRFLLEPETGFYELFDSTAWTERWKINDADVWSVSKGKLMHKHENLHSIELNPNMLNIRSAAIRFSYHLENEARLHFDWLKFSISLTKPKDNLTTLLSPSNTTISSLPSMAEMVVMVDGRRLILWVDGVLLLDEIVAANEDNVSAWKSFAMKMEGNVLVSDILVMSHPSLKVEYFNSWGEKTQTIQYENENSVDVSEKLYDELGRPAIETKQTRIIQTQSERLLAHYKNFAVGTDPKDNNSVWNTGVLQGDVNRLNPNDNDMPYTRVEFEKTPLSDKMAMGLPGKDFSITGPFSNKFSRMTDIPFLKNLFPVGYGYRYQVQKSPNGSQTVIVLDEKNNKVANYVRVQSYNHLLSTYEYDNEKRVVKYLPPIYHEQVDTASKTDAWKPGDEHLTEKEKEYQRTYGSFFEYDKNGNLIKRSTPDIGTTKFLYNSQNLMKFKVKISSNEQIDEIMFYEYDIFEQVTRTGIVTQPMSITDLEKMVNDNNLQFTQDYQRFQYAENDENPLIRGAKKNVVTYNGNYSITQEVLFDEQRKLASIKTTLPNDQVDAAFLNSVHKEYYGDSIRSVTYPLTVDEEPLSIIYSYDKLKKLIGVGTKREPSKYISIAYDQNGLLSNEIIRAGSEYSLSRTYQYNSPGYLESISDPYLTETLSYTNDGYGQKGFGDGIIMHTTFNATWSDNADKRMFRIAMDDLDPTKYPTLCIKYLQQLGYIDPIGRILKLFVPSAEIHMPGECGGSTGIRLAQLIAEKQRPTFYGHKYAYGNHQELVNAKYFNEEVISFIEPLKPDVLANEIPELQGVESVQLFEKLAKSGFLLLDTRQGHRIDIAKQGTPIVRIGSLKKDLIQIDEMFDVFVSPISKLLISLIGQEKSISLQEFIDIFLQWRGLDDTSVEVLVERSKENATKIYDLLSSNGYLTENALEPNFISALGDSKKFLPKIVRIISQHFDHSLGEYPFDVESYEIDANGNHRLFYNGFYRYKLDYVNGTNKIDAVRINRFDGIDSEKVYKMDHDSSGNVVKALHKNIDRIEYEPISQRTKSILMTDGRKLEFFYDAKGERILKRVIASNGTILQDTYYVRDDAGSVLLDRQIKYFPEPLGKKVVTTAYLYGPNGLIGFIRDNEFYNVITDHSGSVRVIIKNGLVVAAYDYMPYGESMRVYGSDPLSHIAYRYTGQEFDEETGLYNYHARLYDPSIGRFYQIDPQSQYSTPYKYAGNSPISKVDPDGEFVEWLIIGAAILIGAYLGGAAANNRWNPADWDFSDKSTWFGIIGGAVTGAFLPAGFTASALVIGYGGTIALGAAGTYLMVSASQQSWDPTKWNFKRPALYYGIFSGFAMGTGIVGTVKSVHEMGFKAWMKYGTTGKRLFIGGSYLTAGGVMYGSMVWKTGEVGFWEWNYASPETWGTLVSTFKTGVGLPKNVVTFGSFVKDIPGYAKSAVNFVKKVPGQVKAYSKLAFRMAKEFKKDYMAIMLNPKHPFYDTVLKAFMVETYGVKLQFDVGRWAQSAGAYEEIEMSVFAPRFLLTGTDRVVFNMDDFVETRLRRAAEFIPMANDVGHETVYFNAVDLSQNETIASSSTSSTKINFWPLNLFALLKGATKVLNNFVFLHENNDNEENSCSDYHYEEVCENGLRSHPALTAGDNVYTKDTSGPSIIEMGDQWLAQTNIQGNLMLGMILIQKIFGRGQSQKTTNEVKSSVELDIEANRIVDHFINVVMQQSLSCGIAGTVRKLIQLDNLENVIKSVRDKINSNNVNDIPQLLIKLVLIKNLNSIIMKSSKKQADKLLKNVEQNMIEFKKYLIKQQDQWMFAENSARTLESPISSPYSNLICHASNASLNLGRDVRELH